MYFALLNTLVVLQRNLSMDVYTSTKHRSCELKLRKIILHERSRIEETIYLPRHPARVSLTRQASPPRKRAYFTTRKLSRAVYAMPA